MVRYKMYFNIVNLNEAYENYQKLICTGKRDANEVSLDLLNNSDWVSERPDVAVQTAVWHFSVTSMFVPARQGDFAATSRIINEIQECDGGPGDPMQKTRVKTYKRIRQCFGLEEQARKLTC
ncbi:unnamed protein product [Didymodactylos carnosus]|uniref:Uncharacterized protein n=1 Tax=Didymodactylos carnosus TaxID=1234261 RepID=A0A815I9E9_9BILA|nr:unnamed protein product [Didymodactylos carnosus]CAF1362879.1 unnamed protein product [Didymodactylos carnosus]CAF4149352.1 unnamed protein product [Didymodactylos carnosus]CAF4242862.1 unnamed protein product [Didymodactylos carnosus]